MARTYPFALPSGRAHAVSYDMAPPKLQPVAKIRLVSTQKFSSICATTASASAMSLLFGLGHPQLISPLLLMPAQGAPFNCPFGATLPDDWQIVPLIKVGRDLAP